MLGATLPSHIVILCHCQRPQNIPALCFVISYEKIDDKKDNKLQLISFLCLEVTIIIDAISVFSS